MSISEVSAFESDPMYLLSGSCGKTEEIIFEINFPRFALGIVDCRMRTNERARSSYRVLQEKPKVCVFGHIHGPHATFATENIQSVNGPLLGIDRGIDESPW